MIRGCALTCVRQYTSGANAEQLELLEGKLVIIISIWPEIQEHWKDPYACETKIKESTSA